jgi:ribosomal protein S14
VSTFTIETRADERGIEKHRRTCHLCATDGAWMRDFRACVRELASHRESVQHLAHGTPSLDSVPVRPSVLAVDVWTGPPVPANEPGWREGLAAARAALADAPRWEDSPVRAAALAKARHRGGAS